MRRTDVAMALSAVEKLLPSKFRGCLVGALLGDCLGSPFEYEAEDVSTVVLKKYFDKLEGPYFKAPMKQYSDDTCMTKSILESFISKGCFDGKDIAERFVSEYYKNPRRGYGENVRDVFAKLRTSKCEDPFGPAREQFNGRGSYGNGGAMRISPVALYCYHNYDSMVDTAAKTTKITHSHPLGVNGAILQSLAIHSSLLKDPKESLDVMEFIDDLLEKMDSIEDFDESYDGKPYQKQLQAMKRLLKKETNREEVIRLLGNDVAAITSVPTAIYSFLQAQEQDTTNINPFRRTVEYAISLGGDTDTIASMAGAIAGAYYGEKGLNKNVMKHCEGTDEIINLADQLYELVK